MRYLVIACEALRPELEYLRDEMNSAPQILYLEQELHNEPEKLSKALQSKIGEIESLYPELESIVLGFGLCGRGACGVHSKKSTLIFPRVHDCIPLFAGLPQEKINSIQNSGSRLWLSAGTMEYGSLARHLTQKRHQLYSEKFGVSRAVKMILAENSLFANYNCVCHIIWPELGQRYESLARSVAAEINLKYETMPANTGFLAELLRGGGNTDKFLHLLPGQTLEMDTNGELVAI